MVKIIITILLLVLSVKSNAAGLIIGGWSKHVGGYYKVKPNESHNLIGLEYKNISVVTGNMSYNNRAYGVYYTYKTKRLDFVNVRLGFRLGGMYGYKNTVENMLIVPIVSPSIELDIYKSLIGELSYSYVTHGGVFLFNFKLNF